MMNQAKARPFSVIAKALHLTGPGIHVAPSDL